MNNTIINMIVKMMFTSYGVAGFRFLIRNVHWFSIFEAPFQNMLLIEHVYRFWKYHQSDDFVVLTFHLKKRTVFCFFFHLCRPWVLEPVGQPVLGTKSPEVNLI